MPLKAKSNPLPSLFTSLGVLMLMMVSLAAIAKPMMMQRHSNGQAPHQRFLMTHYMPWFQAKPFSPAWGWHWTMNHYNPDIIVNGRRQIASHYYPLIGPYDSDNPDTLKCQVLLMKMAGIDGVIVDWYGNDTFADYAMNNRNTEALLPIIRQAGLRFAICYEDQTVPKEIAGGVFPASQAVAHGQRLMQWMQTHFFSSPAYLKIGGHPVLLSFGGTPVYNNSQWNQIFSVLPQKPLYFTESDRKEPTASIGGFDWPNPRRGTANILQHLNSFYQRAKAWPMFIPCAFPRFHDIYQQAGVGPSYGRIADSNGQTFTDTLTQALQSKAQIVQLVTWNDWGEGTQIEPSTKYRYRDLEATQRLSRKYLTPALAYTRQDLRLPVEWYLLRQKYADKPKVMTQLSAFFPEMVKGHVAQARALLAHYQK